MGNNWLDSHARRSAARRQGPQLGMNRRQVLVRGTAVAGGAWAASSLVSAPAYAFGVSTCTPASNICGTNTSEQQVCCANAFQCASTPGAATNTCVTTNNAPGGNCGSTIGGTCSGGTNCSNATLGQCGGQGATCQAGDVCGPGFAEANGNGSGCRCRRVCDATHPCPGGAACNVPSNGNASILTCAA